MTANIGVHQTVTGLEATGDNAINNVNADKARRKIVAAKADGASATTVIDQPSSLILRRERKTNSAPFLLQPNSLAPLQAAFLRLRISFKARIPYWLPDLTESCMLVSCRPAKLLILWLTL